MFLYFLAVESELETEICSSQIPDASNNIVDNLTSKSTTTAKMIADGSGAVEDSGVDSESTNAPSSPEENASSKDTKSNDGDESCRQGGGVDSDVMETAEMLLSLSGNSNNVAIGTSMATTTKSSSMSEEQCSKSSSSYDDGLKDDFVKSLRLQKKDMSSKVGNIQETIDAGGGKSLNAYCDFSVAKHLIRKFSKQIHSVLFLKTKVHII